MEGQEYDKDYDVVVVGAGIAGAIIAKTLTKAGKRVLMLDAGLKEGMITEPHGAYDVYMDYMDRFYTGFPKAPNVAYPNLDQAKSIDVLNIPKINPADPDPTDKEALQKKYSNGYLVQKGPLPFTSDNVRAAGGTTLHWLGTTLRMMPSDFEMKTKYGLGNKEFVIPNWPFSYDTLRPYYEMAENEIGVSGNIPDQLANLPLDKVDQKKFFSKDYVYPMSEIPASYLDNLLRPAFEKVVVQKGKDKVNLQLALTPQGRNSMPNKEYQFPKGVNWNKATGKLDFGPTKNKNGYSPVGSLWSPYVGQRCEGNASCVPICPVQAKYDALKTIKDAKETGLLTTISQAVASTVIKSEDGKITGVRYKKYRIGEPKGSYRDYVATGKIYVLAASAIENAKILLASDAANSSKQVGKNLMDHLCLLTWGLFPEAVYPFRGPGSTTNICTFRDGDFRKEHTAWICPLDNWGWGWPVFSPGSDTEEFVRKGLYGSELRDAVKNRVSRQVLLHFECEQDPQAENCVTIDPDFKDDLGNYRPVIHYNVSEYVLKAFEAAKKVSDTVFQACRIEDHTSYNTQVDQGYVTYNGQGYTYRGAGHIVGTHRMGKSKTDSVVNENMCSWDHDNLYLAGCGNMPTIGTSNPTLTMAATTFKAAESILNQLDNQSC